MRGAMAVLLIAAALVAMALAAPSIGDRGIGSETVQSISKPMYAASAGAPRPAAQPAVLFQRTWGGLSTDTATAVTTDPSGNIYVAGITTSFGPCSPTWYAMTILKYSPAGTLLMQKIWSNGSDVFLVSGIAVDSAGDIYIAGATLWSACLGGYWYPLLLKLDPAGNLLWAKTISMVDAQFNALAVDAAGNAYVTGSMYNGPAGSQDIIVLKFGPSSALLWGESWGGSGTDNGYAITIDGSGNAYVAGSTSSYGNPYSNAVVLKLDSSGTLLFRKVVGNGGESASGIALDSSGDIYVAGTSFTTSGQMLLLKLDPTSGILWERTWGGAGGDSSASALAIDASGAAEIAGSTNAFGTGGSCTYPATCNDIALVRIDASGNLLSSFVYGNMGSNEQINAVTDAYGRMVTVGAVNSAPPYQASTGNASLGTPSLFATATANASMGSPSFPVLSVPGSTLSTPSGNTTYAGQSDEVLMEYGTPPSVSFATDPAVGGNITFAGTSYSNGASATAALGPSTATAVAGANFTFTGWSVSGGVSVANASGNTTQVTVLGSGTLTAHFQALSPPSGGSSNPAGFSGWLLGLVAVVVLVVAVLVMLLYLRRRRGAGGTNPPPGAPPPPP